MATRYHWASREMDLESDIMIIPSLVKIEWIDVYVIISGS